MHIVLYADEGERFATGSPVIRGAAALRNEWRKYLSSPGTFQWNTSKVEVSNSGDLAYETGRFVLKTVDKNGQATTTNGKYVCVWKKQQDGKWKVVADIDNPDSWPAEQRQLPDHARLGNCPTAEESFPISPDNAFYDDDCRCR
jgi:ketosteroid isomerase-like protein